MKRLHAFTIQGRLIQLTLVASALALLCVLAGVLVYESTDYQPRAVEQLRVPADILKELLRPALDFDAREDADRYLSKYCESQPGLLVAVVYDASGEIFASYSPTGNLAAVPSSPEPTGVRFSGRNLTIWERIESHNQTLGHLYLHEQLPTLFARLPQYGLMLGTVLISLLIVGAMLLLGARRNILAPLRKLTDSVEKTNNLELPLPVKWDSQDELGRLISGYNEMIGRLKKSNDDHRDSERRYRGLFENTEISVWNEDVSELYAELNRLRSNGVSNLRQYLKENEQAAWDMTAMVKVVNVNQATLGLFGANNENELIPQISKTFGANAIDVFIDELCAIWEKQPVFRAEAEFKTLDGKTLDIVLSFQIPKTADGFHSIPVALFDITERKQAEMALRKSEAKFSAAFDLAAIGKALVSPEGQLLRVNPAICALLGYSAPELLTMTVKDFTHPDDLATSEEHMEQLLAGEADAYEIEKRYLHRDGHVVWVSLNVSISRPAEGVPEFFIGEVMDITARKVAEAALIDSNRELLRSNAELQQFAYAASHDLIEPLRSISGSVQLLQKRYGGALDARADEFIEHAVSGSIRMQALIEDLLAFAKIGSGSFEQSSVEMTAIFTAACDNLRAAITESSARITHDDLPRIVVNENQWVLLLQNLIANAIKFRGDKPVSIHVGAKRENDDWVFSVADQGIGIEPQYAQRIFELFKRLHSRTEYSGTGVGLALCEKIVSRHGGRIWVESIFGQGATFFFTLPVNKDPHRSLP